MSVFGSRAVRSAVMRVAVVLSLAPLLVAWMLVAGAVPHASACDVDHHRYAEAVVYPPSDHGVLGTLNMHCLYQPNDGQDFATTELWDATNNDDYWEEAGVVIGWVVGAGYYQKYWFWADSRPGGGFNFHLPSFNAAHTNTDYPTEILYGGSQTWTLWGGNSFEQMGTSTSQSASILIPIAGTEMTDNADSGMRDIGHVAGLQRENNSNKWVSWDNNYSAENQDLGPGYYVNSSYNPSTSYESWSGPC